MSTGPYWPHSSGPQTRWIGGQVGTMTRSDNDSWDLASSVGATASMVAAARAVATRRPNPLINDPYSEVLMRAAGVDLFARLASGSLEYEDVGPGWHPEYFAVRTRFFDDFLTRVVAGSARQVVIVGSGLDSRAYRLEWPEGTDIYEIDQPAVIKFKMATLSSVGATPRTELRTVGVDLRQDWPMALRNAGFDPTRPTAWIIEGLMIVISPATRRIVCSGRSPRSPWPEVGWPPTICLPIPPQSVR